MNDKIKVEYDNDSLILSWSRLSGVSYFFLFLLLFLSTGLLLASGLVSFDWLNVSNASSSNFLIAGCVIFILAIITVRLFFNRVVIDVNDERILVREDPIPWPFIDQEIPSAGVQQLYAIADVAKDQGNSSFGYAVNAVMKNGEIIKLIGWIPDIEMGVEIERRIETHLKLKDRRIMPYELPDYGEIVIDREYPITYGKPRPDESE